MDINRYFTRTALADIGGGVDGESQALFHRTFSPSAKVIDAHPQTVLGDLKAAFGYGEGVGCSVF